MNLKPWCLGSGLLTVATLGFAGATSDDAIYDALSAQNSLTKTYESLMQDVLIFADLWTSAPEILSAGYGFDSILGVPDGDQEADVRDAGGTWNAATCASGDEPPISARTSAATPSGMATTFGNPVVYGDGLPVVFSWPVLPSTVQPSDFEVVLNTGVLVTPAAVSLMPNYEYNERNTLVLVSPDFGNRKPSDQIDAIYPVEVRIVADDTPLMLVGPAGPVSVVGLWHESGNPYDPNSGPYLVGAKLTRMSRIGDWWPRTFGAQMPNDGLTLYGEQAQYRLRVLTSGGFSPDGVRAVLPTDFSHYFRLHVELPSGETAILTQPGIPYRIGDNALTIVGLADLGRVKDPGDAETPAVTYDDCYDEDSDNYIDIILAGDEAAMRRIRFVEIPAGAGYAPFYNPGGPGNAPTPGVTYTEPGPTDLEPVLVALDNPMTVTYIVTYGW
jgi:hypothetical protein